MLIQKKFLLKIILLVFVFCHFSNSYASEQGKLYVVGLGPAGPDLTAPRALAIIERADVLLCSPRIPARFEIFGSKIDPKRVALDPWKDLFGEKLNELKKTNYQEWVATTKKHIKKVQSFIMQKIEEGKTVALIDGGDPCIYGPSLNYLLRGFDESLFEVIPGLSAFNAAGAALKRSMTPENVRFVMLTSPESLFGESWENADEILKDLSKYETTMVFFMSIKSLGKLVDRLKKYYAPILPIAVVYYAGYVDKEKVFRSKLGSIEEDIKKIDEKWLGLVVIGTSAG